MGEPRPSLDACRAAVAAFWTRTAANKSTELLELFHADAISHDPVGAPPITTPEAHLAFFDEIGAQFSKISFRTETVYERPPFVSVRWYASATLTDGGDAAFDGLDVFEIGHDGLIRSHWGFWQPDDASA